MADIGLIGEDLFSTIARSVDFVLNRSQEDKTGWDFILEEKLALTSGNIDEAPCPVECKVQIKTSMGSAAKSQITLTNMLRFAISPMPAFIVFIELNTDLNTKSIYVVHVGEKLIESTLKRVWKHETKGDSALHKRKISIAASKDDKLQEPFADSLLERIRSVVGKNPAEYSRKKMDYVNSIGFEDGRRQFDFQLCGEENLERLLNLSIGMSKQPVEVQSAEIRKQRFGIKSTHPLHSFDTGTLTLDVKPTAKAKIIVKSSVSTPATTGQGLGVTTDSDEGSRA